MPPGPPPWRGIARGPGSGFPGSCRASPERPGRASWPYTRSPRLASIRDPLPCNGSVVGTIAEGGCPGQPAEHGRDLRHPFRHELRTRLRRFRAHDRGGGHRRIFVLRQETALEGAFQNAGRQFQRQLLKVDEIEGVREQVAWVATAEDFAGLPVVLLDESLDHFDIERQIVLIADALED